MRTCDGVTAMSAETCIVEPYPWIPQVPYTPDEPKVWTGSLTIHGAPERDPGIETAAVCAHCQKREAVSEPRLPREWVRVRGAHPISTEYAFCSYGCVSKWASAVEERK